MAEETGWGADQWGADAWGSPDGEAPLPGNKNEKRDGVVQSPGVYPFQNEKSESD